MPSFSKSKRPFLIANLPSWFSIPRRGARRVWRRTPQRRWGLAVEAADEIKRSTGATVLLIHHSGYEGDHARGSTAVHAALDAQSVLGGTKAALTLTCTKQKDSDEFEPIRLALADASPARLQIARERLTEKQEQALEALRGYPSGLRARKWQKESGLIHSTSLQCSQGVG